MRLLSTYLEVTLLLIYSTFTHALLTLYSLLQLPPHYSTLSAPSPSVSHQPLLTGYSQVTHPTYPSLVLTSAYSEVTRPYSRFTPSSPFPCSAFSHWFHGCVSAFPRLLRGYSGLTSRSTPSGGAHCRYSATTPALHGGYSAITLRAHKRFFALLWSPLTPPLP